MLDMNDVWTIEEGADSAEVYYAALQRAINSGSAWRLQGSYGRAMMQAIEEGFCMLGHDGVRDYWGSYIPSRSEVKEGTKGSREYVVEHSGEAWAKMMEAA